MRITRKDWEEETKEIFNEFPRCPYCHSDNISWRDDYNPEEIGTCEDCNKECLIEKEYVLKHHTYKRRNK